MCWKRVNVGGLLTFMHKGSSYQPEEFGVLGSDCTSAKLLNIGGYNAKNKSLCRELCEDDKEVDRQTCWSNVTQTFETRWKMLAARTPRSSPYGTKRRAPIWSIEQVQPEGSKRLVTADPISGWLSRPSSTYEGWWGSSAYLCGCHIQHIPCFPGCIPIADWTTVQPHVVIWDASPLSSPQNTKSETQQVGGGHDLRLRTAHLELTRHLRLRMISAGLKMASNFGRNCLLRWLPNLLRRLDRLAVASISPLTPVGLAMPWMWHEFCGKSRWKNNSVTMVFREQSTQSQEIVYSTRNMIVCLLSPIQKKKCVPEDSWIFFPIRQPKRLSMFAGLRCLPRHWRHEVVEELSR